MADPISIGMLATAVIGAGTAGYTAYQQHKMGQENKQLEMEETDEQASRLERQQEINLKRGRAAAGASGTRPGTGSQQTYLSDVAKQQESELAWLRKSGVSRAGMLGDKATAAAVGTAGRGLASAGKSYGEWWSSTAPKRTTA